MTVCHVRYPAPPKHACVAPHGHTLVSFDEEAVEEARTPAGPWEALMVCEPHSDPEISCLERLAVRDVLIDAIDSLDPRRRWVFEAYFIEHRTIRTIAEQMSLSVGMVHKLTVQARVLLYEYLRDDPIVKEHLGR